MRQANLDKLQESGIVKTLVSKKLRRREIDKNNAKLLNALQDSQTIKFIDNKVPRSRSSRSKTILLAQQYGGNKFKRTAKSLLKSDSQVTTPQLKSPMPLDITPELSTEQ